MDILIASAVLYGGSIRDMHGEFIVEDITDDGRYVLINWDGEVLRNVRRTSIRPITEEVNPS